MVAPNEKATKISRKSPIIRDTKVKQDTKKLEFNNTTIFFESTRFTVAYPGPS